MTFKLFFDAFYIKRKAGALHNCSSKKKIVEFFFINATFGLDGIESLLPTSDDGYEKWFDGIRNPNPELLDTIAKHGNSDKLAEEILRSLDTAFLPKLIETFKIQLSKGDVPDKRKLTLAITEQFIALAAGGGEAENIIPSSYKKPPEPTGYETYIQGAINRYRWVRLPGEEEQLLDDVFVCNNIGTSAVVFPHRARGRFIENATLEKIRTLDRHSELKHALIIGACGYGKTLMLQHLFLEAAYHRIETGLLPIFAELRNFSSQQKDFLSFLTEAVTEYDRAFTEGDLIGLLKKGRVQILLDGLDEMDPEETIHFQKKLKELKHAFPNNQIIISSRYCKGLNGITEFMRLYIHPMTQQQAEQLIDKLLQEDENKTAKETIRKFTHPGSGFIRENGFVATNPMLLTIMVRKHKELEDIEHNRRRFYETMYKALTQNHDEEKEAFARFFHSVSDTEEFTLIFREFCAKTYIDRLTEFDDITIEMYLDQLEKKKNLQNPSKLKLNTFLQDVCATACMMYEQENKKYYIDPGFQEYFFAAYYYLEPPEKTKKMALELWEQDTDTFIRQSALRMLYDFSKAKTEQFVFLPCLNTIFRGKSDQEGFLTYLSKAYGNINYTLLDSSLVAQYCESPIKAEAFFMAYDGNFTNNVVLDLLFSLLNIPGVFYLGARTEHVTPNATTTQYLTAFYDTVTEKNGAEETEHISIRAEMISTTEPDGYGFRLFEGKPSETITDDKGQPVIFGYGYNVDPLSLKDKPEELEQMLGLIDHCEEENKLKAGYEKLKHYYQEISERQKKHQNR